jgi:hypothetical protein
LKVTTKCNIIKLMSRAVKIINLIAFCTWGVLISLLLYRNYTGEPLEKMQELKGSIDKATYWYDIYAGQRKIGFASTTYEKVGDEIIIKHNREIKVKKDGHEKLLMGMLKCLSDSYYSIKSFEYASHFKDEEGIKVTGEVDSGNIIFFLESPEKRKTYKISTNGKNFYLPVTLIPALHQKKPAPNTVFQIPMLDLVRLSINDVKVVLEEIRPIKAGIQILSSYKFKAGNAIWWGNENGIIIKEESLSGITLYSQVETIAKDPSDRILFDYTSLPFFKSEKVIPYPEKLKMLKVRIRGLRLDPMLYENSLITLKNDTLKIGSEDPEETRKKSYTLPYKNDALSRYLKADEWVRSDDKNVKGNALNMAVTEKNDAFHLARYLNSNLYFTVKVMPLFVLLDSLDIFKSRLGDDRERTVMFASFARAAGLPTRLIGGLVYRDGYFYFHTWPEVWFDKWMPVDPTLAQFPADVTHIPLKEGTLKDITSMVDYLREVNIEILEAS